MLKRFMLLSGIVISSCVFAACNNRTSVSGELNSDTATSPTNTSQPSASPIVKAKTTNEAQTTEDSQLKVLDQNATSVDQSMNDQAINVNQ